MDTTFAELGLNEQILQGVEALGFSTPTPVQAQAIPAVLAGRDVVASAQTGTGKTAAFTLPVLQLIAEPRRLAGEGEADQAAKDAPGKADSRAAASAAEDAREGADRAEGSAAGEGVHGEAGPTADSAAAGNSRVGEGAADSVESGRGDAAAQPDAKEAPAAQPDAAPASADVPAAPKKRRRRRKSKSGAQASPDAAPQALRGPRALVVTPTRELAQQIDRVAETVARIGGQRVVTVIGGERYDRQIKAIKQGCDMLVATPGRLLDLMERRDVDLAHVRILVLDEADRMLDMGFWPSVRKIIAALPRERQTLLFSATISGDIQTSMPTMLHDPVSVEISRAGQTADTVEQRLVPVVQGQKVGLLAHLIEQEKPKRVLVFCRTKQRVDSVAAALERAGLKVGVMHADRRQRDREKALTGFRSGALEALVATDVMSRGIDVSGIDWVVNFDVPLDPEDYVHRIGRTGRAGHTGIAFTFMAPDEVSPLREIEYFTKELVPVWEPEGFEFAQGRIVPNAKRATSRSQRSLFSGSRGRGRGPAGGRFGRHT